MEQNMDGENNHQQGEWEKHEIDRELLEQLDHLFHTNQRLFGAERHKAHSRRLISNLPERDPDTEERKQMFLDSIQRIEQFQRDNQVRPSALKVDSAIAICKKFKDSEEILSLGPSATIRWRGICHQDCESNGNIYCEYCRSRVAPQSEGPGAPLRCSILHSGEFTHHHGDLHCGFCRFSMWIKDQKLPEVLKVYCKNVLHFLGEKELCGFGGNYWIPVEWMDQENGNEEQHQVEDN